MPVTFTIASPLAGAVAMPAARFAPQIQLADVNAARILHLLGYGGDAGIVPATGCCDAADFLGRVLLALALTLTDEQKRVATSQAPLIFVESVPGSGKTTVAAERFGVVTSSPPR